MITVIIPCLNEKSNINIIKKNIFFFRHECHLIVDGESNDDSEILYKKNKINFITTLPSRGLQQKKEQKILILNGYFFCMQIQSLAMRILRR